MATREQKKRMILLTVILAVFITAICLTAGVFSDTLANIGGSEAVSAEASRTPVYTYIIGDGTVEAEEGFVYDESTSTYRYKEHATGWTAAITKSKELYNAEIEDANLVKVQLASDWVAVEHSGFTTVLGTSDGFINGTLHVPSKNNIMLDLCGRVINRNLQDKAVNWGGVIRVNGGTLDIVDSSSDSVGKITGGKTINAGGGIVVLKGKLILNGGEICNNSSNTNGGGIYVEGNADFIMNGGKIDNCFASKGGGIYIKDGKTIINGGEISENTANTHGGGIYSTGELVINDVEILKNTASEGGGIYQNSTMPIVINGGKIALNTAQVNGGAINIPGNKSFIINDCEIYGNLAKTGYGGGVYIHQNDNANLILNGGKIFGNSAHLTGGGITANGKLTVSGTVIIENNYKQGVLNESTGKYEQGASGVINNITLMQPIDVNTLLDAKIHVTSASKAVIESSLTYGYGKSNTDINSITTNPAKYFIYDNVEYATILNADGEVQFTNQGALDWTVSGKDGADIEHTGYGVAFTYSANKVGGLSLKQGDKDINDITVTKADTGTVIDLATNPLTDAGTYYATATVKGIGDTDVEVQFKIVILPYSLESEDNPNGAISNMTCTLSAEGWFESDGTYNNVYDGQSKNPPTVAIKLDNIDLTADDYSISYLINGEAVTELKEVGEYTVVITGTGNYTGTVYADEIFIITPDSSKSYVVTWQYYKGTEWIDIDSGSDTPIFTYTSENYTDRVRVVLNAEEIETRYVYAEGVTEYRLADGEEESNVTKGLIIIDKARSGKLEIVGARDYSLAILGEPNYVVEETALTAKVTVSKYDLANIVAGSNDTADIDAQLNNVTYDTKEKELLLSVSVTLSGNKVVLGTAGAEYEYTVKYINADGSETEVDSIILGGTYKVYITAVGDNVTGTLGVVGTVTVEKAKNNMTLSSITSWQYGLYDNRLNSFNGTVAMLHDGSITGTERAYIYYTVQNSEGLAVSETLTGFTALSDEVIKAINALGAGSYTVVAEVDGTESYEGATTSRTFSVLKANNRWIGGIKVSEWTEGAYSVEDVNFYATALHGDVKYTVKDASGNVITDLTIAEAGEYTLTVEVAETADYTGLSHTVDFVIGEKIPAMSAGEIAAVTVLSIIVAGLAGVVAYMLIKRRRA